jgi:DNA-binding CsgD family transcriptional regulator
MTDLDLFSKDERAREPMYAEFLLPNGYGWGAASTIRIGADELFIISYEKSYAKGPVDAAGVRYLDALRPHFARSVLLSSRLEFERINGAMTILELTGTPAAVVTSGGRVAAANALFEAQYANSAIGGGDQLRFASGMATEMFKRTLRTLDEGNYSAVQSIPLVTDSSKLPTVIIHILPFRRAARDFFSGLAALVIATPVSADNGPTEPMMQALFDLSPMEARVARAILSGKDAREIAADYAISVHTARTHIKRILEKSGMSRQVEFVAALSKIGKIPGTGHSAAPDKS